MMSKFEKFMRASIPVIYGGLGGQSTMHLADAIVKNSGVAYVALFSFSSISVLVVGTALSFKYQNEMKKYSEWEKND